MFTLGGLFSGIGGIELGFKKAGFKTCQPFAHYKEDPNSCYYSKEI